MKKWVAILLTFILTISLTINTSAANTTLPNKEIVINELASQTFVSDYHQYFFDNSMSIMEYKDRGIRNMVTAYLQQPELFDTPIKVTADTIESTKNELSSILGDTICLSSNTSVESYSSDAYATYLNKATDIYSIEIALDTYEGLSVLELATGYVDKEDAEALAKERFPLDSIYEDSLRHFAWNYFMTFSLGIYKARTIANNHEWSYVLQDSIIDTYDMLYNSYLLPDQDEEKAAKKAYEGVVELYSHLKADIYDLVQQSLANFTSFFSDAMIRDLHNNCYGRAYAKDNYIVSNYVVNIHFSTAWNNGELIMSDYAVTYDHKWCVWSWDWYSY